MEIDPFEEIPNSFLDATFERLNVDQNNYPPYALLRTLSSISALYLYVNPPPMGYGTPAPKVAETVLRAYDYNKNPEHERTLKIDRYNVDNPVWTQNDQFPFESVNSNWHPGEFHQMCIAFLVKYYSLIDDTASQVIEHFASKNSDILTTGRQTWCPLTEKSLPCPHAYANYCAFMRNNGIKDSHTVVEIIKAQFELMEKEMIKMHKVKPKYKRTKITRDDQQISTDFLQTESYDEWSRNKRESRDYMMDNLRSFCSYIKHGERSKLTRRAIASPTVPLRAFFKVIEEFHLLLGKGIEGSTISIGGEEKKKKIVETMTKEAEIGCSGFSKQATQDATKWNECLSPSLFGMFVKTLFDPQVRRDHQLPDTTHAGALFARICMAGHFILSTKMITLGPGLIGVSDDGFHGQMSFDNALLQKFNEQTQKWVERIRPLRYGNNYITASPGMLMGMHNALSTTIGLVSVGYKMPVNGQMFTLRSSDDSMTLYTGDCADTVALVIDRERINLKMSGINLSHEKTLIFRVGFGEYTSWFQDDRIVSQYGPETTTLRPGGKNAPDDFYGIAKGTSVSLMKLETNAIGAEAKLRLGTSNVRQLYRINPGSVHREGVSPLVQVMADGGKLNWNCMNCHLEETSLKRKFCETQEEEDYLLKIRNPDNPFSHDVEDTVMWNPEVGTLTLDYVETPRTIFHFKRRANRTIKNLKGKTHADTEKDNAKALEIITMADISTTIKTPTDSTSVAKHVKTSLEVMRSGLHLDPDEQKLFEEALESLFVVGAQDDFGEAFLEDFDDDDL